MRVPSLLLVLLLATVPARAVDVVVAERVVVLPEALQDLVKPLGQGGVRVVVVPQAGRLYLPGGLAPMRGTGLALRLPFDRRALKELRAWASSGGCRLVVHAESGLRSEDLALLDAIGPCLVELHVARVSPAIAETLARLRRGSVVLESGTSLPGDAELLALARLPRPVLALDVERGLEAHAALVRLSEERITLATRAVRGVLPAPVQGMARDETRRFPLRVIATGGLDARAARVLRALPRTSVEVSLEGLTRTPDGFDAAMNTLLRAVDGPFEHSLADEDLDAPLLRF